jgi:subtilisin
MSEESSLDETIAAVGYAQVIVTLKASPLILAARRASKDAVRGAGLETAASSLQDAERALQNFFIVPSEAQAESLAASAERAASRSFSRPESLSTRKVRIYSHLGLALGFADAGGVAGLEAHADVEKVMKAPELSLIRPVASQTATPPTASTWGIKQLKADRLWAAGYTGEGVVVGHLDTGVDGTHPALARAIAAFAEFDMAGDQVVGAAPHDSDEHGTHTAGTIVGRPGGKGAVGMAPNAKLASAMVIEGGQVVARILGGMEWIITQGAHIISMSLGLRGYTPAFQAVIDALRAANVLPIFAVGNEGANSSRSPGNYANVLSVGAMGSTDTVPDFSSSQRFIRVDNPVVPDLVAPGVAVLSSVPGNGFAEMDGSSMATPHVAGLAALLLQAKPDAAADDLEKAILRSCTRPASMVEARANLGVPDAVAAFQLLTGHPLPDVIASSAPLRDSVRKVAVATESANLSGKKKKKKRKA